jgi:MFS family permease
LSIEATPAGPENEADSKRGLKKTFDALSVPNYRWYWLGSLASFFGNYVVVPAQAWLAYDLTHSAFKLGLVSAAQGVPMVLIVLFSGVIIDRVQKRSIILFTQSFTVVNTLFIAILIFTGAIQYWHLLLSSFLAGINLSFNTPTRYSIVAELVPKDKIYNAFALNNGGSNSARVLGPSLSGILIAFAGTQSAYFFAVGFYIIATFTMTLLKPTRKPERGAGESMINNLTQGVQYLRMHNIIIILLIMEFAITLFGMPYQGLMPVFADILKASPKYYGFMLSSVGIGAVFGSLAIASLGNFKRKGLLLLIVGGIFGIVIVLFANSASLGNSLNLGSNSYYLAIFWLVTVGICSTSYTATSSTVIQMATSDEFRGRVTAFFSIILGLYPISIMIAGAMAQGLGAPFTLTVWGGCLTLFMLAMTVTNRRIREI